MKERLERLARAALELVYPTRAVCAGCGSQAGFPREWLCEECREQLAKRWVGAFPPPGGFDGAASAFLYAGPAGGMARTLKFQGARRLADRMGESMADALARIQPTGAEWIVPVPMHPKRLRQRGFNHAALLSERVGARCGLPVRETLARVRDTVQQARLPDELRLKNMDGAFALAEPVAGRRVLLVDDVCTTGATASECARVLREGGAEAVYLLCFAVAQVGSRE